MNLSYTYSTCNFPIDTEKNFLLLFISSLSAIYVLFYHLCKSINSYTYGSMKGLEPIQCVLNRFNKK